MSDPLLPIPDLIRETLRTPRAAARRIMDQNFPAATMWEALFLVVVLSVLTGQGAALLAGSQTGSGEEVLPGFFFNPILLGIVQGILLVLAVLAVHGIGRGFGGRGRLPDAIALVAWLQFLMVCLQLVQGAAMLLVPFLSALIGIAGVIAFFYLLTQFVCELHGFTRPGLVFAGILAAMVGIIMLMSVVLGLLGIGQMEIPDV